MKWLASIATSGLITVARVNVLEAQTKEASRGTSRDRFGCPPSSRMPLTCAAAGVGTADVKLTASAATGCGYELTGRREANRGADRLARGGDIGFHSAHPSRERSV
jgi:hypothetical protein